MKMAADQLERTLQESGAGEALTEKWRALQAALREMGSVVVAYSGGVDSGFLAFAAWQALGERMLACTLQTELETAQQFERARRFAQEVGFGMKVLPFALLSEPAVQQNPPDRCYHCKRTLLNRLHHFAAAHGYQTVIEGQNVDDQSDYRPGRRAVRETHTRSPLMETGWHKAEIRRAAYAFGLSLWDLPSAPCLATRFPYGTPLEAQSIQRAGEAEAFLQTLGFRGARVRVHDNLARIEVPPDQLAAVLAQREPVLNALKELGYAYISLDLQGYRLGSFNENLNHLKEQE